MYCKNCGYAMDPNAAICVQCGCNKGVGTNYCPTCGQPTVAGASVCASCGSNLTVAPAGAAKSKLVAGLLGILLGGLGIHNFYLGNTKKGVIQLLLSLVGSLLIVGPLVAGIWGLVDGIMILCGKVTVDGNGNPLKD